jgi:microcystin-dependent protein
MSNNGGVYSWSQIAASNAGADNTVNWAEGQAPSSINDSARAMMASVAKFRDDISGSIVTTGTSTAYIVSSNQDFDTLAHFGGQMIAFCPHTTNGAGPVTITIDGFANLPLRSSPNTELPAGVLVQGTPYICSYNATDNALYLQSFYGASPYLIPLGASIEFWGTTPPNSSFALPYGQAISRTTYATLFALFGTTYGAGDGVTTFNIPDIRGRITPCADNMGGTAAGRITNSGTGNSGINGAALGTAGGEQTQTLLATNLPPQTPAGTNSTSTSTISTIITGGTLVNDAVSAGGNPQEIFSQGTATQGSVTMNAQTFTGTPFAGQNSTPVVTMPPLIICNRLMRIL